MTGERRVMQEALFYGFSLERRVPDNQGRKAACWPRGRGQFPARRAKLEAYADQRHRGWLKERNFFHRSRPDETPSFSKCQGSFRAFQSLRRPSWSTMRWRIYCRDFVFPPRGLPTSAPKS